MDDKNRRISDKLFRLRVTALIGLYAAILAGLVYIVGEMG